MSLPGLSRRNLIRGGLLLGGAVAVSGLSAVPASAAVTSPLIAGCDEWGARPPAQPVIDVGGRPNKIIVHHTATANSTDYSQAHAFALARSIQNYHMDSNGWIDTGQHFTISRGGWLMEGRHRSLETLQGGSTMIESAHCVGQNRQAIGIENEGTYRQHTPPAVLWDSLVRLCAYTCQQYGISPTEIYGHMDFNSTACPGKKLYSMLPQLRTEVAALLGA